MAGGLLDFFNKDFNISPQMMGLLGMAQAVSNANAPQPASRLPLARPGLGYTLGQAAGGFGQGYGAGLQAQGQQTQNQLNDLTLQGYQRLQQAMGGATPPTMAGMVGPTMGGGMGGPSPVAPPQPGGGATPQAAPLASQQPSGGSPGGVAPLFDAANLQDQYRIAASTPGMQQVAAGILGIMQKGVPEGSYMGVDGSINARPGYNQFLTGEAASKSLGTEVPKAQASVWEAWSKPQNVGPGASVMQLQSPVPLPGMQPTGPGPQAQEKPTPIYTNPNSPALVNMGLNQGYGEPPKDMAWARNPDGSIMLEKDPKTGAGRPMAVPIGGTTAERAATGQSREQGRRATAADLVSTDIDRVIDMVEKGRWPITGGWSVLKTIPGTPQHDAQQLLVGIKSNVAFDRLQAMRDASPTGGALGQVSNYENQMLQSAMGSLEQSQRDEQFLPNLKRVKAIYQKVIHEGLKPGDPVPTGKPAPISKADLEETGKIYGLTAAEVKRRLKAANPELEFE